MADSPLSAPPAASFILPAGAKAQGARLPDDEEARLALLRACDILDTAPDPYFDDLTRLAAQICGVPIALISLLDEKRQWFKSRLGLDAVETPRQLAFCAHAILNPTQLLIVPDARQDPRFADNELVTGEPHIRFYAGMPLRMEEGQALGSLCVIDRQPRELTAEQLDALAALGRQAVSQIQLRRQNAALREARIDREAFFTRPLDMLCIAGADGFFKHLNPAFSETLGFSTEELLARPLFDFVHPEDVASTHAEMALVVGGMPAVNFEHRFRCQDGSYRWLSWKCAPAPDGVLYASARDVTSRKQMKETLERQRAELRLLFDYMPALIVYKDTKNGLLRVNQRLADSLGKTVSEVEGKSAEEIFPRDAAKYLADDLEVIQSGKPKLGIIGSFPGGDDREVWVQTDKVPVRDRGGEVIGLIAMAQDITERRAAEEQMRLSEALIRQFIEHAPAAIAMLDAEMRYLQISDRWLKDYHLEGRTIIGRSHYEVFPDVPEHWKAIHQRVLAGAVEHCEEDPFPRADGGLEWLQWEARPWYKAAGEVGGLIFFTQVITARKAAEAELRRLNQMQRGMLDSAAYAIIATDGEGVITEFNPAAERMLGYTAEEMVGRSTPAIFHDHDEVAARAKDLSAELGREINPGFEVFVARAQMRLPNHYEWTHVRKDGSRFPVHLSITALWDGAENIVGFLGITIDITERKEAERLLRNSLTEKDSLLQEIHHRVKNNLQVISSLLSLQSGYIRDPQMLAQFQESQGRIRSMALIHEKLYQSEKLARVDLKDYLESLARIVMSTYAASAGLRLESALAPVSTTIDTAVPLGLLVNELLTNAVKYAFPGQSAGRVRLTLERGTGADFTLVVEDDGVGLPAGFDLSRAKTLGLRLVGMLVKQLRAEMTISSAPGRTNFRIRCAGALDTAP